MPELDDLRPGPWRVASRADAIRRTAAQINYLQAVLRLELNEFVQETPLAHRKFCGDQLALHLAESPGTMDRLLGDAQVFADYPTVVAHVAAGHWTIRHADALLDELLGSALNRTQREEVIDLVAGRTGARTPYEIRRAARAAVLAVDPEAAERQYEKVRDDRRVSSTESNDGSATLYATGPKHLIAQINACLDTMATPRQPEDTRSLAQRRFDTLMDLVCGRAVPGQWTAYVMVRLEALEHLASGEPAQAGTGGEVPGLGLITMTEAQEVLGLADVRRAVVDEHDQLVSLDSLVTQPDLPAQPSETRLISDAVEPAFEPAPEDQDEEPSAADRQWAFEHEPEPLEAQVEDLLRGLAALLAERPLALAGSLHLPRRGVVIEIDPPQAHGPAGPRGPEGPSGPDGPEGPPDPPPSRSEEDWLDAELGPPFDDPEPPRPRTPPRTPPASSFWSAADAQRALTLLTSRPPDHRPLDSTGYALPPRLARYVKARDITCTFPGCIRLAQYCQNDHVIPWPAGTSTEHNMRSECTHHHQAKHAVFTVTRLPGGGLRWTTATGHSVDRSPRPFLRGW